MGAVERDGLFVAGLAGYGRGSHGAPFVNGLLLPLLRQHRALLIAGLYNTRSVFGHSVISEGKVDKRNAPHNRLAT